MTFSLLAHDPKTGIYGGAAATGSLCVGGWVLRGDAESGLTASQGTSPSTLWGTGALTLMREGKTAVEAVHAVTSADPGRDHRQLAALDPQGGTAAFTGSQSVDYAGEAASDGIVATGNMLSNTDVLPAMIAAFTQTAGEMPDRLLAALRAAKTSGGDFRGLKSAALLVVSRHAPPLTLRIDLHPDDPIGALEHLHSQAMSEPYHSWTKMVPTLDNPTRDGTGEAVA